MDSAATRKEVRRKEKESRLADRARGEVMTNLMSSVQGRNYVWDKLAESHVFTTSFSPDALAMAFAEGERNSGLRLLDDILSWCPDQFILMMREHNERSSNTPGRTDDADGTDPDVESFPDPGADIYAD